MKNYKLDTSTLPKVWVTWATTKNKQFDKRYWLNCQTGKKKNKPEDWMYYRDEYQIAHNNPYYKCSDDRVSLGLGYYTKHKPNIWVKSGSNLMYAYAKYHADIERLEVAVVQMDTSRKPEARKWTYAGDRFFIGKDKSVIDDKGNSYIGRRYHLTNKKSEGGARWMLMSLLKLHETPEFINEFKKFIGCEFFTKGNGSIVNIERPWHIETWFTSVQKTRKENKSQKSLDSLTALPLSDASGFAHKYPPIKRSEWNDILDVVYFERVSDEWSVLRSFYRNTDDTLQESWRCYIGDNGKTHMASYNNGWLPASSLRKTWYNHYAYLANQDEAIEKCNRLKYIINSIGDIDPGNLINAILVMLRHPEIEQLMKLGMKHLANNLMHSSTPKADLKDAFGGYFNEKEKSILRKVGLSKYQFDKMLEMQNQNDTYSCRKTLSVMREVFGNDLSPIDNASFNLYLTNGSRLSWHEWGSFMSGVNQLRLDKKKMFKNVIRLCVKYRQAATIICDTMGDYLRLNHGTQPEIDWYFPDISDATRAHNAIIELKRIQDAERRALWDKEEAERLKKEDERRKKVDEERKQYEYEDEEYIIRLPKDLAEIISEGHTQHICIGGYTGSHATGQTNLFFLRKKSEPDTPFYAIEMTNGKYINQIHGFGNKWLGNDPDAIPTVIRWLRKHDIRCEEAKLTCKATGYHSCNEYVPMPVVD